MPIVRTIPAHIRQDHLRRPLTLYVHDIYTRAIRSNDMNIDFCLSGKRTILQNQLSLYNQGKVKDKKTKLKCKSMFKLCCGKT